MKRTPFFAITLMTLALAGFSTVAMAQFEDGVHYFTLEQAASPSPDGKVEVTEAFSYLCNHCNTFEPFIQNWKSKMPEGVTFNRIPVVFGRQTWGLYAQGYVTAAEMGVADEAHVDLMNRIWKEQKPPRSLEQLADFYTAYGVDKETFLSTAESFSVDMRMRNEQKLVRDAGVNGTPSMLVNGKYRVAAGGAISNFDMMLAVVDFLVAQELAAQTAEAAPEAATESAAAE